MPDHADLNQTSADHLAPAAGRPATLSDRVRSLRLAERVSPGRSRGAWLPWTLCAVLALTTAAFGFTAFGKRKADAPKADDASKNTADSGDTVLESKGYVIPAHQIQVSPKVNGMVVELYIEEGKQVWEGDVLAQLETTDYEAEVRRARANLTAARHRHEEKKNGNRVQEIKQALHELEEAQAELRAAEREFRRIQDPGVQVSQTERDKIKSAYDTATSKVNARKQHHDLMAEGTRPEVKAAAEAEVRQAEAALVIAEWKLDNCTVRAPVSGTILTKRAEQGNLVNPVAFTGQSSLCDMADLSDLEVELSIQERDIAQVFKGQKCRVTPEAFQGRKYEGHVSRVMPIADRAKGALPVRVKLVVPKEEEGVYLKPDMGVIVSFLKAGK